MIQTDLTQIDYIRSAFIVEASTLSIMYSNLTGFVSSDNGGAVSSTNCDVNVAGSYFKGNKALMGGALYLYCDEDQTCTYYTNSTTFTENTGLTRGGAMHYNYFAPII